MPGLYIHIPFCVNKCPYCDFYSCDDKSFLIDDYIDCVGRELKYYRDKFDPVFETLFIGGGTPTSLTEKQLDYLFSTIYGLCDKKKFREITIEANPETVTEKTARVISANCTRASLGCQSFDDRHLKTLGRIHASDAAGRAAGFLKQYGMKNLSADIMFGIPGQDVSGALSDIKAAAALGVNHISYYMMTIYEGTEFHEKYAGGKKGMPAEEILEEMYMKGIEQLADSGYSQYEISNFSKPGHECLHNLNYWKSGEYAGLGAAAATFWQGKRYVNVHGVEEYIKRIRSGSDPAETSEEITPDKAEKEFIMLGLRMKKGIDYAEYKGKLKFDFKDRYSKIIDNLEKKGLLMTDKNGCRLTVKGMLLSNTVISDFF